MTDSKPSFPANSASLRAQLTRGDEWPEAFRRDLAKDLEDLSFDRDLLWKLASAEKGAGSFIITMLSKEYLPLGVEWARCARKAGIRRFAVAALDSTTADVLGSLDVPHVRVDISPLIAKLDGAEASGFNSKGLAILASRIALVKFLVDHQMDVTTCDVDALLLRNPDPYLSQKADISFQKVALHPKPLSAIWGLTACCGFMAYRGSARVSAYLDHLIALQQEIASDDQLVFNLALYENGVRWSPEMDCSGNENDRRLAFVANASEHVYGTLEGWGITLEALPANLFWRHDFVPLDLDAAVLVHPNSPKSLEGKLEVFRRILGQDLETWRP
jgi:hypothetical protein